MNDGLTTEKPAPPSIAGRFYSIHLPMPVSINAAHTVGKGFWNPKTKKYERNFVRSDENKEWREFAAVEYRNQFPGGIREMFAGRLRMDYLFVFVDGARGTAASDIDNRIKVLNDFLQQKFFDDDKQIDEIHAMRRLIGGGVNQVIVRIIEIPDRRFEPFIGNPAFPQPSRTGLVTAR